MAYTAYPTVYILGTLWYHSLFSILFSIRMPHTNTTVVLDHVIVQDHVNKVPRRDILGIITENELSMRSAAAAAACDQSAHEPQLVYTSIFYSS